MYAIVPKPKKISLQKGKCSLHFPLKLNCSDLQFISEAAVFSVCEGAFISSEKSDLQFLFRPDMDFDYRITAQENKITVMYKSKESAFHAFVTLWQIYKNGEKLSCFEIADTADFKNRGFMLDISRGKVPKPETVKHLVDMLARFKYNQLQLYIEGFSFCYPTFAKYCDAACALTVQEIKELSRYCRDRFIALVANQNSLGHMAPWLEKEEFASLAECVGGFSYGGFTIPSTTLDVSSEESIKLVEKMADDLLPCFTSDKMHVGLDEPFEMGRGKNFGADTAQLFSDYVNKLDSICTKRGRKMIMWADALHRFNCFDKGLPKDVIYLEWGYEKEYPFDKRCKMLHDNGLDFYVCPGTSSWLSFTGLTDNAIENIDNAVCAAVKYNAQGILLTDWGDCNHMQPLPVSYAAIVYCSGASWNSSNRLTKKQLADALNLFVFEDSKQIMGNLVLEAGNYYKYEELQLPCRTLAHLFYSENIKSAEKYEQSLAFTAMLLNVLGVSETAQAYLPVEARLDFGSMEKILKLIENLKSKLEDADMKCTDAELIRYEYKTALDMVGLFTLCRMYIAKNKSLSDLQAQAEEVAEQHRKNWLLRNKLSGLENGLAPFYCFE